MKTVAFLVHGKNGDYVKATLVPANRSEEVHFGAADAAVIVVFLTGFCGLLVALMR